MDSYVESVDKGFSVDIMKIQVAHQAEAFWNKIVGEVVKSSTSNFLDAANPLYTF